MIHGESNPFGMQPVRLQAGCGRAGEPLFLRRSPAGALRSRYHTAPLAAAGSSQRAFQHVAIRSGTAARGHLDREFRRGLDAARAHQAAGRAIGRRSALGQRRRIESHRVLQSPRLGLRHLDVRGTGHSRKVAIPSAGNAASALAAYAAAAGIESYIFMPRDVPQAELPGMQSLRRQRHPGGRTD